MLLILGFFTSVPADEQKKLLPKDLLSEFTYEAIALYVSAAVFIGSAFVPLTVQGIGGQPLRYDFWIFPFITSSIRRRGTDVIREVQKHRSGQNSNAN